jgi:putative ABC transport system permease protein
MNIMLVSVTERIREIGLRMAVGAGAAGCAKAVPRRGDADFDDRWRHRHRDRIVGALLVGKFSDLPVEVNANVVGLAATFSIATGLFFGYYPARKASLLDPIEALRQQ